jgi:hypothetical protein
MRTLVMAAAAVATGCATEAIAQFVPPGLPNPALENRIPAPLPPPPPPPVINGPLSQAPPPSVYVPPAINSPSDRITTCLHNGSARGLRGRRLDAYTRSCANN